MWAIIGAAISILTVGYQAAVAEFGGKLGHEAMELARQLSNKLRNNENLLAKATDAYNSHNTSYASEIFRGTGLGARARALGIAMAENDAKYREQAANIRKQNAALTRQIEGAQQIGSNVGSITGIVKAKEAIDTLKQNINGGMNENET